MCLFLSHALSILSCFHYFTQTPAFSAPRLDRDPPYRPHRGGVGVVILCTAGHLIHVRPDSILNPSFCKTCVTMYENS